MRPEGWRGATRAWLGIGSGWRGATVLVVAVVAVGLVGFDLAFFAHGRYRGLIYGSQRYLDYSYEVILLWIYRVPFLKSLVAHTVNPGFVPIPVSYHTVLLHLAPQGAAYPVFLTLVQMALGIGEERVRLAQALLHGADAVLVYLLAARAGSRVVGVAALCLFAVYAPVTYMTSQLLTENLTLFLLLACCYLALRLSRPTREGWGMMLTAPLLGLTLVVLALTRPVFLPLAGLAAAGMAGVFAWRLRRKRSRTVVWAALLLGVAFLVPYLAWQTALSRAIGDGHFYWMVSGPRSIETSLHESYDLTNNGWPRPLVFYRSDGRSPFAPPPLESIRSHPVESLALRVEKLFRLWKGPSTIYVNPFVFPAGFTDTLHALLVIGAALGVAVARRGPVVPLAALPVLYTAAVYTLYFSEERRFAYPVMPLIIILFALALPWLAGSLRGAVAAGGAGRTAVRVAVWLLVSAAAGAWLVAFRGAAPASMLPAAVAYGMAAGVLVVSMLAAVAWVARRVSEETTPVRGRLTLAGLAAVLVLPVAVHLGCYGDWHTWKYTLTRPGDAAVQVFTLPGPLAPDELSEARLLVDIRDPDGRVDNLEVRVNDIPQLGLVRAAGQSAAFKAHVENMAPFRPNLDWATLDVVPDRRQWLVYQLDPEALAGIRTIVASVRLNAALPGGSGAITLYGDAPWGDTAIYRGPRPSLSLNEFQAHRAFGVVGRASIWRYQTYGDMRLYGGGRLFGRSRSAIASIEAPGSDGRRQMRAQGTDLSTDPLIQAGNYRIRLQLITRNGVEVIL